MQNRVLAEDVRFLALQDERFKTARLTISLFVPLKEETAALYALMPELLSHATARLPDMIAVHRELSRLYGATVSSGVQRLGDHQVLSLGVSCIRNEFALQGEDVALEWLKEKVGE